MDPNPERPDQKNPKQKHHEEEWTGPIWRHPYFLYVIMTTLLFLFLIVMGWLATQCDWIPNRGPIAS
jgi:prolipoprotein diacylglyceryltransferase